MTVMTNSPQPTTQSSYSKRYYVRIRHGWRGSDVHAQIERMASLGFAGIEFFIDGVGHGDLGGTSRLHLLQIRQTLQRASMRAVVTTQGTDPDHLRHAIKIASIIGAEQVRTSVGSPTASDAASPSNEPATADTIARDLRTICAMLEINEISLKITRGRALNSDLLTAIIKVVDHPSVQGEIAAEDYGAGSGKRRWRDIIAKIRHDIQERRFKPAPLPWAVEINERRPEAVVAGH